MLGSHKNGFRYVIVVMYQFETFQTLNLCSDVKSKTFWTMFRKKNLLRLCDTIICFIYISEVESYMWCAFDISTEHDFDTCQIFDGMWRYNSLSKRF